MKKEIFSIFAVFSLILAMSFIFAETTMSGSDQMQVKDVASQKAGDINTTQPKPVPATMQERIRVQEGMFINAEGTPMRIQRVDAQKIRIQSGERSAECDCNLTQKMDGNRTRLFAQLANGKEAEIKVMPDAASQKALERLRLKNCVEEEGCRIELKEVGSGNDTKLAYEMQLERHSRILGIFSKKMQVRAEVDAENGEVTQIKKPWWAFLATEPAQEESSE